MQNNKVAESLLAILTERGVKISDPKDGELVCRLHFSTDANNDFEAAQSLAHKIGRPGSVQFGRLPIPPSANDAVHEVAGCIIIRRIKDYDVAKDEEFTRWDILVDVR